VFAALGAVAANYFQGDPIWLMLVGAPSTGKTVIVNACSRLPDCRRASNANNASAFLTWDRQRGMGGMLSPHRMEQGEETGGIGEFGIMVYPEFTSILSQSPDVRTFISSVHRDIYDGQWSREFGSNGGRVLTWNGKCGSIGAVTPAVDRHSMYGEMGERWLYYRLPPPDLIAQANAMGQIHSEDPADRSAKLSAAVMHVFNESGIMKGMEPRGLNAYERQRMSRTVRAACLLRGTVARDHHHRDVIDLPQVEGSGRMFSALASIFFALEKLGLRNVWCWKIVRKIAFDGAPGLRIEFIKALLRLQHTRLPLDVPNVRNILGMSPGV